MPRRRCPTNAEKVIAAERSTKALELRKAGLTHAAIARQLGCGQSTVSKDVKKALQELRALRLEHAEDIIEMEISRQEELLRSIWLQAKNGSPQHIDRVQEIIQRITLLHGVELKGENASKVMDQVIAAFLKVIIPQCGDEQARAIFADVKYELSKLAGKLET